MVGRTADMIAGLAHWACWAAATQPSTGRTGGTQALYGAASKFSLEFSVLFFFFPKPMESGNSCDSQKRKSSDPPPRLRLLVFTYLTCSEIIWTFSPRSPIHDMETNMHENRATSRDLCVLRMVSQTVDPGPSLLSGQFVNCRYSGS